MRYVLCSGAVSLERWCRLRGNLLFYLRAAEQWAEPLGVIVLEQCTVRTQQEDPAGNWPFQIGKIFIRISINLYIPYIEIFKLLLSQVGF